MDLIEIIKTRRSVRSFDKDKKVDEKDIKMLLDIATWAPSGGNVQPWRFYVITRHDLKNGLCEAAYGQEYIIQAPYSIVICIDTDKAQSKYKERGLNLYSIQDTAAAVQNILLTAHSIGLATCWIGAFNEEEAKKVLNLKEELRPVAIIPVGYAKEKPFIPPRTSFEKFTTWL